MREWRHAPGGFVAKGRIGDSSPRSRSASLRGRWSAALGMTWARGVPLLSFRVSPERQAKGERHLHLRLQRSCKVQVGIPEARDWTGSQGPIHYDGGPVATRPPEEKHR